MNGSYCERATNRREPAMHDSPDELKMPYSTPLTAWSRSASSNTMVGDLPPSSSDTGIILSAAICAMCLPVVVPPVNDTRRTSGCLVMASPITEPLPGSTLIRPRGTPASSQIAASSSAISGVTSAGLTTTALPAASAGAIFCASLAIGEFHGVMAATTPIGS
ncbi:hypothetical protein D3C81_1118010 [compost metagenome]